MAKKIPRWVVVCGIGCGTIVLVGAGLLVGGALLLRSAVQDFEQADEVMEAVEERYGPIEAFRPLPGGGIPAERIDAFLTVRENMAPVREGLGRSLRQLSGEGSRLGKLKASAVTVNLQPVPYQHWAQSTPTGHLHWQPGFSDAPLNCKRKPGFCLWQKPGCADHFAYGIRSTCPTKIRLGLTRLLRLMIAHGVTRNLAAMPHTVSPFWMR